MLTAGTIIDNRYEVLQLLGSGGFGSVYKALHSGMDRHVAIKLIDANQVNDEETLLRFEREAKTVASLNHPGIVRCFGFGVINRSPYMVLELLEGTPLDDILKQSGSLSAERAVEIMKQVFDALGYAHRNGIVHRDMKPGNIMVLKDGSIKIIDFGLVQLLPGFGVASQKLTETGYALGTCHYMAPEQALGGTTDPRADIYACGCILYELLSGQVPFDADDHLTMLQKHLSEEPKPLASFLPVEHTYYSSLVNVVETCMAKDLTQRYADCDQVIADLNSLHSAKAKRSSPPAVRPRRWLRNNKKHIAKVLTLLVGAIAVFATLNIVGKHVEQKDKQEAVENFPRTSKEYLANFNRKLWKGVPSESVEAGVIALDQDDKDHMLSDCERFCLLVNLADQSLNLSNHPAYRGYLEKARLVYPGCVEQLMKDTENDRQLECWLRYAGMVESAYGMDEGIKVYEPLSHTGKFCYGHAFMRAKMAKHYLKYGQIARADEILSPIQDAGYLEEPRDAHHEVADGLTVSSDVAMRQHKYKQAYDYAKSALDFDSSNADAIAFEKKALAAMKQHQP